MFLVFFLLLGEGGTIGIIGCICFYAKLLVRVGVDENW